MPTKEGSPISIPEEDRGTTPNNRSLEEIGRSPEKTPVPEILQETTPEEKPSTQRTQPEVVIFQTTPETPIETQERNPTPEKTKKERRGWLERLTERKKKEYKRRGKLLIKKLEKEGVTLTEEDKRKLYSIPAIWTINAAVSTAIGLSVAGGSVLSLMKHRDFSRLPSLLSYNLLIPGGIRLLSTIAFEQSRHIKFDGWSKIAAFLSGWGMPVEIAIMSRKSAKHRTVFKILLNEVKEHYFTNPLAYARNLYGRARKMMRRK